MAGIDEYSTTAASNTAINTIPLSDSTLPNQVDNAIRQLMADVRTFANDVGGKAVSAGTDTVTLTTETVLSAYADGTRLTFIAGGTNTGAATLNVDSVGAKAIVKGGGTALSSGDIVSGMAVDVVYDASQGSGSWMLLNPTVTGYQPLDADLTTLASAFGTASASGAAYLDFAEDTDNGSNRVRLQGAASTADVTVTLPSTAGTVALTSDLVGKQTIFIPASAMTPRATNGAATGSVTLGTNVQEMAVLDFDASTDESAHFVIAMPKGWNEGTISYQVWWRSTATDTDGVAWTMQAVAMGDGEVMAAAYGSDVIVTDAAQSTQDFLLVSGESGALTIGGSPAAGDLCLFRIYRDVSDAADTMAEDARLIGIKLFYTTDALTDA